jgi:hypothetical protein
MSGERILLSGEGTYISGFATKERGMIKVMLINFQPDGNNSQTVPVTLSGLSPGKYRLRQKYFLGEDTTISVEITGFPFTHQIYMPSNGIAILSLESTDKPTGFGSLQ